MIQYKVASITMVQYKVTSITQSQQDDGVIIKVILQPTDEKFYRDFSHITLVFGGENYERGLPFALNQHYELKAVS